MLLVADTVAPVPEFPVFWAVLAAFFGAVIGGLMIAYYIKQLFFVKPPNGHDPVTEKQFKETVAQLEGQIKAAAQERTVQLMELDRRFLALNDYAHDKVHELNGLVGTNSNKQSFLEQRLDQVHNDWFKRLEARLEQLAQGLGVLGGKVSQLMGRFQALEEEDSERRELP